MIWEAFMGFGKSMAIYLGRLAAFAFKARI